MKKLLVVALVGLFVAPAMADLLVPGGEPVGVVEAYISGRDCPDCERVYENLTAVGDMFQYDDLTGGNDDYQIGGPTCPEWPADQFEICEITFIGGVPNANDQLRFDFFEADGTWVTAFAGTFPSAGIYIWTLSWDCPTGLYVPDDGIFQIGVYGTTTSFSWISETDSAEIGTEDITYLGPNAEESWTFAFAGCVPEPASLSLLALGALVLIRRR